MENTSSNKRRSPGSYIWKALLAFVCGLAAVLLIISVIQSGIATGLEESILKVFRNPSELADPLGSTAIEEAIRDLTSLGGTLVTSLLALYGVIVLLILRQNKQAWFFALSVLLGTGYIFLIKLGFDRPRPEVVSHYMRSLSPSFPSGHSASSAMVLLLISGIIYNLTNNRALHYFVFSFSILLTLAIGVSRIYMGVHWPTDVLGGWIIGFTWAGTCWMAQQALSRKGWFSVQ